PGMLEATVNLGAVLFELGLLTEAEDCGRRAVALAPGSPEAHNNLALALREQGDVAGAREEFDVASALAPTTFLWQSGRLLTLNYLETIDEAALQLAHRQVGQAWTAAVGGARQLRPRDPDPTRPLRVGYVSPDLRTHSVAYFVEAFLGHHDPAVVEVTCYHDGPRSDAVTDRLRALAPRWRPSHALSDERFLALVDED